MFGVIMIKAKLIALITRIDVSGFERVRFAGENKIGFYEKKKTG